MSTTLTRVRRSVAAGVLATVAATAVTPVMAALTAGRAAATPAPIVASKPLSSELGVVVTTGGDDLAGGSNANLVVSLTDGYVVSRSLNNGQQWAANTTHTTVVSLTRHVLTSEIASVRLDLAPNGSDSWDANLVAVDARSSVSSTRIVSVSGTPYRKLTPTSRSLTLPFTAAQTVAARPAKVDLRAFQTAQKSQGSRRTCIIFSAVAATEAAYKRAGYGDLDLSEEFRNFEGKAMFLDPNRSNVATSSAPESQLATTDGGNGLLTLKVMADGFRIPLESTMPYRSSGYTSADNPQLSKSWDQFTTQRDMDAVNLDPNLFPDAARSAATYYGITGVTALLQPNSTPEIESILASNREVEVDLTNLQHSVLIVGYDRTDASNPVFFVKDSGGFWNTDARVMYSRFVKVTTDPSVSDGPITSAGFVTGVREPAAWSELAFLGRWNLDYDGWRGVLDIYHVPGISQAQLAYWNVTTTDRRIGTFYDASGNAFRVNGSMSGSRIVFSIDSTDPNMNYDKLSGRRFDYTLMRSASGSTMSGTHTDPDGHIYAGYARKDAPVGGGTALTTPLSTSSYLGAKFATTWLGNDGTVQLESTSTPSSTNSNLDVIRGTFTTATGYSNVTFAVDRTNPGHVTLTGPGSVPSTNSAQKLSWERGILAGQGLVLIKTS